MKLSQPQVVCALMDGLSRAGIKTVDQPLMNVVIECGTAIWKEAKRKRVYSSDRMGLYRWLNSDDTGLSSQFMAHILAGGPACENHYPRDPSDFGRCYRMLRALENRVSVTPMENHGPVWAAYAKHWDEMERIYENELPSGKCPELYALMQKLQAKP